MNKVLIVDVHDSDIRLMSGLLMQAGYEAVVAENMDVGKEWVAKLPPGSAIVAASKEVSGIATVLNNRRHGKSSIIPIIAIVDNLNPAELLDLIHSGITDVIQRQGIDKQLVDMLRKHLSETMLNTSSGKVLIHRLGESFSDIEALAKKIGESDVNVVIFGESGTGKEHIASQIYQNSARKDQPITVIEAGGAALVGKHDPATLQTEIYSRIAGYFQKADGGTILLKNIHLLTFDKQSVLLHILENEHPDVRVICTAEPELLKMVTEKTFRPNLFYILRQVDITVPPLRETIDDIVPLAEYFLEKYAQEKGQPLKKLDVSAIKALLVHSFPGNVRELKDVVLFAAHHCEGEIISAKELLICRSQPEINDCRRLKDPNEERDKILQALEKCKNNKTQTAKLLNISRRTLLNKLKQYGLN